MLGSPHESAPGCLSEGFADAGHRAGGAEIVVAAEAGALGIRQVGVDIAQAPGGAEQVAAQLDFPVVVVLLGLAVVGVEEHIVFLVDVLVAQLQANLQGQLGAVADIGVEVALLCVEGVLATDEEAVGVQGQVEIGTVELALSRVGVLVVVAVQADGIGDLPVVTGVIVDFLTGAVVIVVLPVVAVLDIAGPHPGIKAAGMAEHDVELGGGVAEGLRDAAGAVVAEHGWSDGQRELLVQFDGAGLQAAGERGDGQS